MSMFGCNCNFKCNCTAFAVLAGVVIGIIGAFLQITGVITLTPVYLAVALGIAVVYLAVLLGAAAVSGRPSGCRCVCSALNGVLAGLLGTILLSVVLLLVGIVATSVVSAILVGLLLLFFTVAVVSSACFVRYATDCSE